MKTKKITEDAVERLAINLLEKQGYTYIHGSTIAPEGKTPERESYSDVILKDRLQNTINTINPDLPSEALEQAFKEVINLPTQELFANNEAFHMMLTNGIEVEYSVDDNIKGNKVWLIDYENISNNDYLVCNQFTVIENNIHKRPDVILFINGLPLVVIELKNPAKEDATIKKAFTQLQNYKTAIPSLFYYNSILVASDGLDARSGSITSALSRFHAWKSVDGQLDTLSTTPQLETIINGMLKPVVLLDLIKRFVVFERTKNEDAESGQIMIKTEKKIAAYHQYYAVNKAVISTHKAVAKNGNGKGGVVWHTQGSGKSLSMVFFAGKLILSLNNPTIVVLTDRNDLDDQLFDTFVASKQLLRQTPVQAENKEQLKELLNVVAGGIIFTTIHKFSPENGEHIYPLLSKRRNIVIIADEAHRSQYGFKAKTVYITDKNGNDVGSCITYGFAKYMREALPNASFIGFTGTPVEKEDANTQAVFGNYIDIYDVTMAVEDGSTVRIYYENRLAKVKMKDEEEEKIDDELSEIADGAGDYEVEYSKSKWSKLEAIVGHKERIRNIARDIIYHFNERESVLKGKAMIVTMSRRIAVQLYEEIIKLKPEWHDDDRTKGVIKVIMTNSSSDPESWQKYYTTKFERKDLSERFKNPNDPLTLVVVIDMWLTGFDAPCLHTLYMDKPLKGHNLMQAIARVNRVYKDKEGGLIVDYIGIANDLKNALSTYVKSGCKDRPTIDQEQAVLKMSEKYEIVCQLFNSTVKGKKDGRFDYKSYFKADTSNKLRIILEAQEHILGLDDGKKRFVKEVAALSAAYSLSIPDFRALKIKDEVGFFQAVKVRLQKFESGDNGGDRSNMEVDTAIKQIVDKALVSEGIIDIYNAAGIKKPDISILSDEFMEEIRGMKHKNLALELLKKLLKDEIKARSRKNIVQSKRFSEMLKNAVDKYHNNMLTTTEVIEEIIDIGKEIREEGKRGTSLGLSEDELAFYDALATNNSAVKVLKDDKLRELAIVLVKKVRENTTIDWTIKENVRAKLRVIVKRILKRYGYPPDMQKIAVDRILEQSKVIADDWAGKI